MVTVNKTIIATLIILASTFLLWVVAFAHEEWGRSCTQEEVNQAISTWTLGTLTCSVVEEDILWL